MSIIKNINLFLLLISSSIIHGVNTYLGVDIITPQLLEEKGISQAHALRYGLVTNHTGLTSKKERNVDVLLQRGFGIKRIFAPEHGFKGAQQAEKEVYDEVDIKTNIPVVSLYGNGSSKPIKNEDIADIDVIFFDIQDSGMRHYTYISTMYRLLESAAAHNKKVVILDRPNPLSDTMCGPLVEEGLISFISIAQIPIRHGMTIGELAFYFNKHVLKCPADLYVVSMKNYARAITDYQFLSPLSTNIPSIESIYGYSFLGLVGEINQFDVGVGTPYAFQVIALPKMAEYENHRWEDYQKLFKKYYIDSHPFEYESQRTKKTYRGLRLVFNDPRAIHSSDIFFDILSIAIKQGMFPVFAPNFNKAIGTNLVQKYIERIIDKNYINQKINNDTQQFYAKAKECFLYKPYPNIILNASL